MTESINCSSCGASNQLPEGKNSMFCAFCGNSITPPIEANVLNKESNIKTKPQISQRKTEKTEVPYYSKSGNLKYKKEETVFDYGGALSLINRELKSLDEITSWFSDNELSEIKGLFLNDNKITNLKEIDRFTKLQMLNLSNNQITNLDDFASIKKELLVEIGISLKNNKLRNTKFLSKLRTQKIDLSENEIVTLDDLPQLSRYESTTSKIYDIEINLSNNRKLKLFSNNVIETLNNYGINQNSSFFRITFNLSGCLEFDQSCFKLLNTSSFSNVNYTIVLDKKLELSNDLKGKGFVHFTKETSYKEGIPYRFLKQEDKTEIKSTSGCFIATATMGSYDHPIVMELRSFRDNWILAKSWGDNFVKWYYHYGSKVAKVIEKSFLLKKISYIFIVKPLVYLSRFLKK